ncbi:gamma-glutamyl-gamma-aminobutyrate hydrolase family protein [Aerococcus sp. 1KP-2016]|uniref:gamma-glutamyl-gamma-aminobutyrate hydrolase family protein n=1 Tax=Aerococcus sp. 1KP-2016 TaxID=1981982 RepID=UPI000B997049|nr:gamma-glutamyl-gamma-aminobutyrate hydrolase family protein [Aerococcus sp. 1KP-2016]OYQ67628.1 hypothetical protein B9P78_03290 [Aerococcus sp. 1KP-2016]
MNKNVPIHKRLIGVTGNHNALEHDWDEFMRDYSPHGYSGSLTKAGHMPIIIPLQKDVSLAEQYIAHLDGIVFTGGQDVSPLLYGREPSPKLRNVYPPRDCWERALFEAAVKKDIPILGICRGFQLINILLNGTVYQDLSEYPVGQASAVQHIQEWGRMQYPHHSVTVEKDSTLANLFNGQKVLHVNTYHHQVIEDLSTSLKATAWADDGVIEAFETDTRKSSYKILGVQWHPEMMTDEDNESNMLPIFNWFHQF